MLGVLLVTKKMTFETISYSSSPPILPYLPAFWSHCSGANLGRLGPFEVQGFYIVNHDELLLDFRLLSDVACMPSLSPGG